MSAGAGGSPMCSWCARPVGHGAQQATERGRGRLMCRPCEQKTWEIYGEELAELAARS